MQSKVDKNTLKNMLTNLTDSFLEERKKKKPYKEIFKAGSSFTRLFRHLESEMTSHVLDACDVLNEKHGVKANTD